MAQRHPGDAAAVATDESPGGQASRKVRALRALVDEDLFARLRSDAELARLVRETSQQTPTPFGTLLHKLIGTPPTLTEATARALWLEAVEHRRALARVLGRPVHLRVAVMDLAAISGTFQGAKRAIVVSREELVEVLAAAETDGLTGALRREPLLTILGHETRQRRQPTPLLAYLDFDEFKRVNDEDGHASGDAVLRAMGQAARATLRAGDTFGRMGGDEFCVLLLGCSLEQGRATLRRLLADLVARLPRPMTVSVGFARARAGEAPESVIARADIAMYHAKQRRRATRQPSRVMPPRARRPPAQLPVHARPVALLVSADPTFVLEAQHGCADLGVIVLPAQRMPVASALAALVSPRLAIVDALMPPAGPDLGKLPSGLDVTVVVPAGWLSTSQYPGVRVVRRPFSAGMLRELLTAPSAPSLPPLPHCGSRAEAVDVMQRVAALALGGKLPGPAIAEPPHWPAVDLVVRHLGS
ncbi:MAG: GGDEF domain-containing protein [Deltaproteobacteria bacterium]|nr:GGDEF domain-containing protein [Deltaproteobacteria bacterium]